MRRRPPAPAALGSGRTLAGTERSASRVAHRSERRAATGAEPQRAEEELGAALRHRRRRPPAPSPSPRLAPRLRPLLGPGRRLGSARARARLGTVTDGRKTEGPSGLTSLGLATVAPLGVRGFPRLGCPAGISSTTAVSSSLASELGAGGPGTTGPVESLSALMLSGWETPWGPRLRPRPCARWRGGQPLFSGNGEPTPFLLWGPPLRREDGSPLLLGT